jgi:hypothetical protein
VIVVASILARLARRYPLVAIAIFVVRRLRRRRTTRPTVVRLRDADSLSVRVVEER